MEEILSSIKRIIAEEDVPSQAPRAPRRSAATSAPVDAADDDAAFDDDDQILELTDALPGQNAAAPVQEEPAMTAPAKSPPAASQSSAPQSVTPPSAPKPESKPAKPARAKPSAATAPDSAPVAAVMSDTSAEAARESLVNLSKLLLKPDDGQSNTLEGLVREMLRPMLKEWLDAQLPEIVEGMVKREIDRITGRV